MRDASSAVSRNGETATLYSRIEGAENAFGQDTESWVENDDVLTYMDPSDGLTFFFLPGDTPSSADRIEFNGSYYEFDEIIEHESHAKASASLLEGWTP